MPYSTTSAAATSSCVESGFEAAQPQVGAAVAQRQREVRRLRGDVQAGGHAHALEGAFCREPLADLREHGHLAGSPFDTAHAGLRERRIGDIADDAL